MNADGSGQTPLFDNDATGVDPNWSPDGQRIAFTSVRDGNAEIYVMNADGSSQTRLTDNEALDEDPRWSPDGRLIMFESDRGGNRDREIYVMNADGSAQTSLTDNEAHDFYGSYGVWSVGSVPEPQVTPTPTPHAGSDRNAYANSDTHRYTCAVPA